MVHALLRVGRQTFLERNGKRQLGWKCYSVSLFPSDFGSSLLGLSTSKIKSKGRVTTKLDGEKIVKVLTMR
jgi:hypothetical protein